MRDAAILYPVFVQVLLTFVIMFWMARERWRAVREGTVVRGEPGTRPVWKGRAGFVSNSFHNQLEVPMLFYAVVAFIILANANDYLMVLLAWIYVALRVIHAGIHTTYNHIPHRFLAFLVSDVVLAIMWFRLAFHVLSSGQAPV